MGRTESLQTGSASGADRQDRSEGLCSTLERLLPLLRVRSRRILANSRALDLDPDDLVQEVLVVALVKSHQLRLPGDQSLLGFLDICMRNRVRDEVKKRKALSGQILNDDSVESPSPTALGAVLQLEESQRLRQAWTRLGLQDRRTIAGRVLEGMTFLELARATQRASADAARIAFSRAIARVRRLILEPDEAGRKQLSPDSMEMESDRGLAGAELAPPAYPPASRSCPTTG